MCDEGVEKLYDNDLYTRSIVVYLIIRFGNFRALFLIVIGLDIIRIKGGLCYKEVGRTIYLSMILLLLNINISISTKQRNFFLN